MCSACGFPTRPGHWTDAGADATGDKLQLKFRRASILNKLLNSYGFAVHDDGRTPGIQMRTLTGRTVIVPDLEAVWAEAETQTGTALDPLDARFLGTA
jgi:hypothetical protein